MQSNKKMSALQMYMMLMLSIGISNHVLLTPVLLETAKRDSWIGAIAALLPITAWMFILFVAHRNMGNQNVLDWIKQRYGQTTRFIVTLLLLVFLLVTSSTSFLDTVLWTQIVYLPMTPKTIIALILITICFFAAKAGIRVISIASGLLLPVVVVLGYLVATANFQFKNYSLLTPILTHGYTPVLRSLAYTCSGIFELVLILFMQHHISTTLRFRGLFIIGIIMVGLTIGPLMGAIAIFGPFEAAEQRYPAFEQWRMVTMGKFISHLDFFSIYQWLSGSFIRISLMLFLIMDVFTIRKSGYRTTALAILCFLLAVVSFMPISDVSLLYFLSKWYFPGTLVISLLLGFMMLVLVMLPVARRKESAGP